MHFKKQVESMARSNEDKTDSYDKSAITWPCSWSVGRASSSNLKVAGSKASPGGAVFCLRAVLKCIKMC
jgi:hypothetical protein